ncbi:hypothetical protein [Pseudonocardia lacus]|uniref:hypothetical protein n=1 Tax=Pseudonocardia lacus TaxID=2835865 RepID=UPI001BDBF617|nr:hypothetical protein [Pseudonocardia lacus]
MTAPQVSSQVNRHASGGIGALVGDSAAMRAAVARAVAVPGAKRWWIEPISGGVELHGEVAAGGGGPWAPDTRLAAGAGLFAVHLEIAVHAVRPVTSLVPRNRRPSLLAVLRYGAEAPPTPTERTLHAVLAGARPRPLVELPGIRPYLRRAAEAEATWVRSAVDPGERAAIGTLLARGGADLDPEAMLVLVASPYDLPAGQLRAGRAVQRILLTATALGYPGALVTGRAGLDLSHRAMIASGSGIGAVPQAVLSIGPRRDASREVASRDVGPASSGS